MGRLPNAFYWLILSFCLISCSAKKQKAHQQIQCETIDWYQFGYEFGLKNGDYKKSNIYSYCHGRASGFVLPEETVLNGFRAALYRDYCTEENAIKLGEQGDGFTSESCSDNDRSKLEDLYVEAIKKHCKKAKNGYERGAKGALESECAQFVSPKLSEEYLGALKKGQGYYKKHRSEQIRHRLKNIKSSLESNIIESVMNKTEIDARNQRVSSNDNEALKTYDSKVIHNLLERNEELKKENKDLNLEYERLEEELKTLH